VPIPLPGATLGMAGKQVIIGTDLFRQFGVELDMARNRITLAKQGNTLTASR